MGEVAEHRSAINYARDEYVELTATPNGWAFRQGADGIYEAWGPCPMCAGDAYGPRLVDISRGDPTKDLVAEPVDVACECHCGFDHGGGTDEGCGRWWLASSAAGTP